VSRYYCAFLNNIVDIKEGYRIRNHRFYATEKVSNVQRNIYVFDFYIECTTMESQRKGLLERERKSNGFHELSF
jgi:hypothetical protein